MRRTFRLLPVLAIVFHGFGARAQTPIDPAFAALLQQKLDSCRNVYDVPGISATILLPGDRYWNGATGVADIYTNEPLDTAHVFQAASTTKLFTATIIFQLIDEGLLALDDTIGEYLPPMTDIPGDTQLRYLLNHRSGLADYLQQPGAFNNWFNFPDSVWPPAQVIGTYHAPPQFAQNAAFSYSNTNFLLLGMVIEAVTGNTYAQELNARILAPLGMEDAYFPPGLPIAGALVPGWTSFSQPNVYDTDVTPVLRDCYASFGFAAGAVVIKPNDLARFTRAVMTGALLTPASLTTMRTCTNVNFGDGCNGYGHGAMRYVFAGRTYYGHGGDINGFTQLTIHDQPDSVTLVLSINRNNAPRGPIAAAMLGVVFEGLSTGLADVRPLAAAFELFPVPATDRVTLRSAALSTNDRIDLFDATGRMVRSERAASNGAHELNVQGLPPGAYQVRWRSAHGTRERDPECSRRMIIAR
ncbi:MAG: serine hydrolase [Flavobacteriales bacterium]